MVYVIGFLNILRHSKAATDPIYCPGYLIFPRQRPGSSRGPLASLELLMILAEFTDAAAEWPHDDQEMQWFALKVRSCQESIASLALKTRGFAEFMPTYRVTRRWSDRVKAVDVPLFPGYVFCRFNPTNKLPVLKMPGVTGVVTLSQVPHPLY